MIIFANDVSAYNYNWKNYNIDVPENIVYLEYCYKSNQCEVSNRNKKLIYLNQVLVKNWYNPIY